VLVTFDLLRQYFLYLSFGYLCFGLNLDVNIERILVTLVMVSFVFTSVSLMSIREVPLTREEAVEISRGSSLVKEGLAIAYSTSVEAHYYNSQRIEELRKLHPAFWEEKVALKLRKGHSVWEIIWYIYMGIGGYTIGVIVDAEVGTIINEMKGLGFG